VAACIRAHVRGLPGSRPTTEAAWPASVRPTDEAARRLALASDGSSMDRARQGQRCKHPRSAATTPGKRKRAGLTLAAAQCEGAEWWRRGGGRRWGREGSGERWGGPLTRGRGEGGGCNAALERDEKRRGGGGEKFRSVAAAATPF
jgi:hypothetical protein